MSDSSRSEELTAALDNCPPLQLAGEQLWKDFAATAPNKEAVELMQFASDWARLMQASMAKGATLAECVYDAADVALPENFSAAQLRYAALLLISCWKYGKDLAVWQDKAHPMGDIEGTILMHMSVAMADSHLARESN